MKYPVILLALLTIAACKKKDPDPPYSHWQVNNDSLVTNNVQSTQGKGGCGLSSSDAHNNFAIFFNVGYQFPSDGTYMIFAGDLHTNPVNVSFYYRDLFYIQTVYNQTYLEVLTQNGKLHLKVPPTWFVNYYNALDSVNMSGDFVVP